MDSQTGTCMKATFELRFMSCVQHIKLRFLARFLIQLKVPAASFLVQYTSDSCSIYYYQLLVQSILINIVGDG